MTTAVLMLLSYTMLSKPVVVDREPPHMSGTVNFVGGAQNVQPTYVLPFQFEQMVRDTRMAQLDIAELRSNVEHAAREAEVQREHLTQVLAVAFMTFCILLVAVELRLNRQTRELKRELKETSEEESRFRLLYFEERRSLNGSINKLLFDKMDRETRDKEAVALAAGVKQLERDALVSSPRSSFDPRVD